MKKLDGASLHERRKVSLTVPCGPIIIADEITSPENKGAIIRLGEGMGVERIFFLSDEEKPYTSSFWRKVDDDAYYSQWTWTRENTSWKRAREVLQEVNDILPGYREWSEACLQIEEEGERV